MIPFSLKKRGTVGPITQIGAGSFTSGGVTLQHYLPWVVITNADTVSHAFTFQLLTITTSPLTLSIWIAPGETESYPVAPFQSIKIDTATANAVYFYSPDQITGFATVKLQGNQTVIETEGVIGGINATTAGSVLVAGTTTLPIGTLVQYALSISSPLVTAGTNMSIELIGATSGVVYVPLVGPNAISGSFIMPRAEMLNIFGGNSDTGNHFYGAAWQATSP